jgi:plastocyanin
MKKLLLFLFCIPYLGITQNSHTINTAGNTFSPASLTINVGDTVTWNNTAGYHNVNATLSIYPSNPEGFGNGVAAAPWSFQWIFTMPGTYDYQCDPHVGIGMIGVVTINAIPVPGCTDPIATNYDPAATVDDGSCLYFTLATDLFISEYAEGSGTNKYIEIFNGTGQDVDLSNYQLWKVTNGGTWPEYTLNLSGNLADGHVYIIYSSSSTVDPVIAAAGDVTWSQVTWTGDDAVGLAKQVTAQSGSSFVLIDVIGEDGPDPGTGWNVAGVTNATKDHTLVRKCSVTQGNINWGSSAGTDALNSEWEVFSQNYWTDIDQHTFPCQSAPIYGCTDPTAPNYDPLATIDDGSCISLTFGCTDSTAFNYDVTANSDDGSCCFESGCTDPAAYNYNASACYNDGSCITPNFGCMNTSAMNFDSTATIDDGSCILLIDKVDLFFSEYGEGSSNNKYIEIYNSTSNPVDLSSYALTRVSNAPTTVGLYEYWVDFDSAAVVSANDVYIVAHPSADSVILAQADMTYSVLSNGDDGFALVYGGKPSSPVLPGNEYVILDFVGDFNGDPGSGWDVAGVSQATKDHVLVRKCSINLGNIDWSISVGTDSLNSEWTVFDNEDWSDIGQHTNPCLPVNLLGCTDSLALNYDTLANIDDGLCNYQMTYVPDDNFESYLEANGMGNGIPNDDSVFTSSIDTLGYLNINNLSISELIGIEDFTALTYLDCNYNQLISLDVSQNTDLLTLYCQFNQIISLDVSNTSLTTLRCGSNQLSSLDVIQNTALEYLWCGGNQLSSLNVIQNTNLIDLYFGSNMITILDVSNNTDLINLGCNSNQLSSLDVSQNTALTNLYCNGNLITTINLSNNSLLTYLECSDNQLTSLDITNNTALTYLHCNSNLLTSLDLRNGNNTNFISFNPIWNLYLNCINVDDSTYSTANWLNIDSQHYFSTNCVTTLGCTDSTACNYDPLADSDDGSCEWTSCNPTTCGASAITGLGVTNVIHNRATLNFDNMNTYDTSGAQICRVDQLRIRYREVGTSSWSQKNMAAPTGYDPITGVCNSTQNTNKLVLGLSGSTTYEWEMRVWYCATGATTWVVGPNFTTAANCPDVGNLAVSSGSSTQATFTWDDSNGAYSFVRLQARVDTVGSAFFNIGGVGVNYGTFTKNKNGLVAGESYRAKSRAWCDPSGGAYKAPSWTSFIYWTQPTTARLNNPELTERTLSRITDLLGREVKLNNVTDKTTLLYIYDNGTVEKKIVIK